MKPVGLLIVDPIAITDAVLVESNVPETEHGLYVPATAYTQGQRVIQNHVVWENVVASPATNTGNPPATSPGKWERVSATNRHRMFDLVNGTQTSVAGTLSVRLRPGSAVSCLYLGNVVGTRVRVRMLDPAVGIVFDRTIFMTGELPDATYWDYFYAPRVEATDALVTDLPTYPLADVLVDVDGVGSSAVGMLQLGQAVEVGDGVRLGARVGLRDYSRQEEGKYGDLDLVVGAFAKRASYAMRVPNAQLDYVQSLFASLRSKPVLFIGVEAYKCTVISGIYKSFELLINYQTFSDCNVDLLGMI